MHKYKCNTKYSEGKGVFKKSRYVNCFKSILSIFVSKKCISEINGNTKLYVLRFNNY